MGFITIWYNTFAIYCVNLIMQFVKKSALYNCTIYFFLISSIFEIVYGAVVVMIVW
jgi:hypothetical protein